jgi:hypothetical protein
MLEQQPDANKKPAMEQNQEDPANRPNDGVDVLKLEIPVTMHKEGKMPCKRGLKNKE